MGCVQIKSKTIHIISTDKQNIVSNTIKSISEPEQYILKLNNNKIKSQASINNVVPRYTYKKSIVIDKDNSVDNLEQLFRRDHTKKRLSSSIKKSQVKTDYNTNIQNELFASQEELNDGDIKVIETSLKNHFLFKELSNEIM